MILHEVAHLPLTSPYGISCPGELRCGGDLPLSDLDKSIVNPNLVIQRIEALL